MGTADVPLLVAGVDGGAGHGVGVRLRSAAGSAREALARLDGAVAGSWVGRASEAYLAGRGEVSGRLGELEDLCGVLAAGVEEYLPVVEACSRRARVAAQRVEVAERRLAAATADAAAEPSPAASQEVLAWGWELEDARGELGRVVAEYRGAVDRLSAVARSVSEAVRFTPRSVAGHVRVAGETWWRLGVVDTVEAGWALTGGVVRDPAGWWSLVSSVPGAVWGAVSDPVATADEAVGGPSFREEEWGEGAGTLAAAVGLGKGLRDLATPDANQRFARNMADRSAPLPRVQSVDEMLAGVDLSRHEHHDLGHAIRRHVEVDDDYLNDRLDHGTLFDDGTRSKKPPKQASAFTDMETAEAVITDVLRANEQRLRDWVADPSPSKHPLVLDAAAPPDVGRVVFAQDQDRVPRPAEGARVVVKSAPDGTPFIVTAFPTRGQI
ncbi:RNase A-like domain-containing protein [Thalassiella azotivora]